MRKINTTLYYAIATVSVILLGYDLWMSIQMSQSMGTSEIFSDISYCAGNICDIQLPFYSFWIVAIWAGLRKWFWFMVILLILSPFIVYSGISNFILLKVLMTQITIPTSWETITFLSISGGLKLLLPLMLLTLVVVNLPNRIRQIKQHKTKVSWSKITTNKLLITLGIVAILLFVLQITTGIIATLSMGYSTLEIIEYLIVSPSLLLWLAIIYGAIKSKQYTLKLILLISPLLIIVGLIAIFGFTDTTSLLMKISGGLQLALVILTIFIIWRNKLKGA